MENSNVLMSFGLTVLVGLSMGIGSFISFFAKEANKKFLAISLSFSAGIMVYVSFMAIFPSGIELIEENLGHEKGHLWALAGFFGGMILIAVIEKVIHRFDGGHHDHDHENGGDRKSVV